MYKPTKQQQQKLHECTSLNVCIYGKPGTGKTTAGIEDCRRFASTHENVNCLIISNLYRHSCAAYDTFKRLLTYNNQTHKSYTTNKLIKLENGSTITFGDKSDITNYIGYSLNYLFIDDFTEDDKGIFLLSKVRAEGTHRILIACTPSNLFAVDGVFTHECIGNYI